MSESVRKDQTNPEGYAPETPKMMNMLEELSAEKELDPLAIEGGKNETTRNSIDFHIPFAGFKELDYINCFAAVYSYLEGLQDDH